MKKTVLLIMFSLNINSIWADDFKFGQICITPHTIEQKEIPNAADEILKAKLTQVLTNQGVAAGNSERFIIVPHVLVNNISTTATIPSKTSVKLSVSIAIGDGVNGIRFSIHTMELIGVGNDYDDAVLSALRKIKVNGTDIESFVNTGTSRIVDYYNANVHKLLSQAQASMDYGDYEKAITILAPIPSFCNSYTESQVLLEKCGTQIIKRDNERHLRDAQSTWSANPTTSGAKAAKSHLSHIVAPTPTIIKKVEALNSKIEKTLEKNEQRDFELAKLQICTQSEIKQAEIHASASVASAFYSSIPQLIIKVLSWF